MTEDEWDNDYCAGTNWMPDRGKLYRFSDHGVVVIRPWPLPQAWFKTGKGPWKAARPQIDLGLVDGHHSSIRVPLRNLTHEVAAWSCVPETIRHTALSTHINDDQWSALSMYARCPGALDLARSVPLLAGMLSISHILRPCPVRWPHRSIRTLLKLPDGWRRWRRAASWLGLDESKAFTRMLRRVHVNEVCWWRTEDIQALVQAWAHPAGQKLLSHTPRITREVARLLGVAAEHNAWPAITHSLVQEVAAAGRGVQAEVMLTVALIQWRLRERTPLPPPIRTIQRLENYRLDAFMAARAARDKFNQDTASLPFPSPPLSPAGALVPLLSPEDLINEGRNMHHCLDEERWSNQARRHLGYGYSVRLGNARASVWLRRDKGRPCGFAASQIRGQANSPPDEDLTQKVEQWLSCHDAWARYRDGHGPRPPGEELKGPEGVGWDESLRALMDAGLGQLYEDEIPF
jgi:hypothetical protein